MITVTHVEGEGNHVSEVTVERRVLGIPVQYVSSWLHHSNQAELAALGFYPVWEEFKIDGFVYARGRAACLLLRAYRKATGFFWRRVIKPLYWVGLIDVDPSREFRWNDFWRIKSQ